MSNKTRKTFGTLVLAIALSGATLPALADDGLAGRMATGVGRAVAAQGNIALETIKQEIRDRLMDTLQPLVPEPQPEAQGGLVKMGSAPVEHYLADHLACPAI